MPLPSQYAWLSGEPGPKMILAALKLYGTVEAAGSKNSPTIMGWADEVGGSVEEVYYADSVPWCGLFMAVVAKRADKEIPKSPLWALSWSTFGNRSPSAALGDVLVFTRNGGGHVALYVGEDATAFHCLGGNQSDQVNVTRIAKSRLYTVRRPAYTMQPANVRTVKLSTYGKLSANEA